MAGFPNPIVATAPPSPGGGSTAIRAYLLNPFVVPGVTLSDVTDLTVALAAGTKYLVLVNVVQVQTTSTGVIGISLGYSGTLSALAQWVVGSSTGTAFNNTLDTAMTFPGAAAAANPSRQLYAVLTTSTAGNLKFRAQVSVNTATLQAQGYITATPIA